MNAPVMDAREPKFKDLDCVRLLEDVKTDLGVPVPVDTVGTVVGVWSDGAAYEVEFSDGRGLATVKASGLLAEAQPNEASAA